MADRRCFALTIVDSDAFLDMPQSTRLLYMDLCLRADDSGFVNSPNKIMRFTGASEDDMKLLITKKFVIPFECGVVCIKHWFIHNNIRKDMYKETKYKELKDTLFLDENNAYSTTPLRNCNELVTNPLRTCNEPVTKNGKPVTQVNISQSNISQSNINQFNISQSNIESGLTKEEIEELKKRFGCNYEALIYYIDSRLKEMPVHPFKYVLSVGENENF